MAIPAIAVLGTLAIWYLVDPLYNGYAEYFGNIDAQSLDYAWWQVNLFIIAFGILLPTIAPQFLGIYRNATSTTLTLLTQRIFDTTNVQRRMCNLVFSMTLAWIAIMCIALYRVNFDFVGLFTPYLSHKAEPWGRNRVGGGFDSVISFLSYFQIFLTASFGVLAALIRRPNIRAVALAICFLSFPFYIFDRTRSTMLIAIVPGIVCWTLFAVRGSLAMRLALLFAAFTGVNSWFLFVISNRNDRAISIAFAEGAYTASVDQNAKHQGLNMYEELAWINYFISSGVYKVNWGERYLAELVNPIPRGLWPEKPLIGMDYALARGQGGGSESSGGVHASISTGLIGQGVVNFGGFFGPIVSATLMASWCALLARFDLHGSPSSILLFAIGIIITFNLGRDITFLSLYPFLFGWIAVSVWELSGGAEKLAILKMNRTSAHNKRVADLNWDTRRQKQSRSIEK